MNTNNFFNPYFTENTRVYRVLSGIAILFIMLWFNSCDDFTESDTPVSELDTAAVFEEKNIAYSAMTNVFAQMRDNGMLTGKTTGIQKEMGLYVDELTWYGNSAQSAANFFTNTLIPTHPTLATWWNNSYSQIYAANAVIEGVAGSIKLLQTDKEQLTGEAKFARAFVHFYILQLWGDVPYVTGTDYTFNSTLKRLPTAEVYAKIIEDLESAIILLPEEYTNPTRVRPNSYVAQALLARVYLYAGMWSEAANSASAVLNKTDTYTWVTELNNVFLKGSTVTIWQYAPRTPTRNTDEGTTFIFNAGPPNSVALTNSLVNTFEAGDQRKVKWIRSISKGSSTWYHAYKYKKTGSNTPQLEFSIVLRLAEMYLIRAEARARQGELTNAKDDLNVIRNTAGLGNTIAVTQDEILNAILHERQVELFSEFGHRFFDLRRFDALDQALSGVKANWNNTDNLLPLPQNELNLNPNIGPQNPGY
ncbi:MAG: RagB/SusD family nutrient uptake outer membrane protein [Flavobacterium sp.]|uniref:RagB/SusD family nutrient uptake outer membrane protein n=1 Tax=Flavobacterium sp. TaxID=239 RepID=UPI002732A04E|nr:RagB/SusD family nutrient uptake outer membrane protein [Flavobacterium sp.]MDP3680034.1 RagB/SusD family nutrient uptake outer membrane protein [Flavobacterium sp.]MDZ4330898.1 RagB/SusD family nutrient uptake outer membrane protein [Flavobacterium sp.]